MWPASALLTGNGVAFILRVPGTEHGDWWSMNGWWIFAGTAAVSLLSKYVIKFRGSHVFNPSNFGLVLCFLLLGPERADPLDFWWGPMSPCARPRARDHHRRRPHDPLAAEAARDRGRVLARLRRRAGVLAASGHEMTARWHLGPITGWEFWRVLVFSPEILVFLFFMITDPRTIPAGRGRAARTRSASGCSPSLLIAPQTTEFWTKVAVLGALFDRVRDAARARLAARFRCAASGGRAPSSGPVAAAGVSRIRRARRARGPPGPPRRGVRGAATRPRAPRRHGPAVEGRRDEDRPAAARADRTRRRREPQHRGDALLLAQPDRATAGAAGGAARRRLASIDAAGERWPFRSTTVDRMRLTVERGERQGPPLVVADVDGTVELVSYRGTPPTRRRTDDPPRTDRRSSSSSRRPLPDRRLTRTAHRGRVARR